MAFTLIVFSSACSEQHELDANWQQYQQSLSEVTGAPAEPVRLTAMPIMPRGGELRLEIDRLSIGILDSQRLERCRLGQLVAQRNSALGQAQSPSARLRYELDSILAIEECLQSDAFSDSAEGDDRMREILRDAVAQKRQTLPLYIDQVLTRSEELRRNLRAANHTHPVTPADDFNAAYEALSYLAFTFNSALQGRWQVIDLEPYNAHMQVLMQNDFLPRHWRTMQRSAAWLSNVNTMLESAVNHTGCQLPSPPPNTETLEQQVMGIFVTDIQPMLTRWTRHQQSLTPILHQLQEMSVQGQWRAYLDELVAQGSHAEQVADLTAQHIELWQRTLEACQSPAGNR